MTREIVFHLQYDEYEKFCLEAMLEQKDIDSVIRDRLYYKPFDPKIEKFIEMYMDEEILHICKEK